MKRTPLAFPRRAFGALMHGLSLSWAVSLVHATRKEARLDRAPPGIERP